MFSAFTKSSANPIAAKLLGEPRRPECKSPEPDPEPQRLSSKVKPQQLSSALSSSSSSSSAVRNVDQEASSKQGSSALSVKAQDIKERMQRIEDVDAVLIKPDGSLQQIKYNGSSKMANDLLSGRPTIVGELEGIQTVVVRALNQSNCGALNETVLPVPFCNKTFNGNYLLYRVDAEGSPADLSVALYEQFVAQNKTLTEQAQKNFNPIDEQEIRTKSAFNSNPKLTLVLLRSEVDKKIREEYIQQNGHKHNDSDIKDEVDNLVSGERVYALQELVDDLVSASTPMNDPDYDPSEDATMVEEERAVSGSDEFVDDRDWRLQLNDALAFVRERGRLDGRMLAEKVSDTFYELNGADPTVDELVGVFCRIQQELAAEAEADLLESEEDALDDGSAAIDASDNELVDEYDWRLQLNDALAFVRERGRLDGRMLAEKVSETFYELNGAEPTVDELVGVFRRIKQELAAEAEADLLESEEDALDDGSAAIDASDNELVDECDWRLQLNDALAFVRERGRLDGRMLAEKVSETFYELNGAEPTVDELVGVFRRIKQELAAEAEADLLESEADALDDGSAFYLARELGPDFEDADPIEIVEYATRIVQEDLVSRATSSFKITKGRSPSRAELRDTVELLAEKLADQALATEEDEDEDGDATEEEEEEEEDEDGDYDPNNMADERLAEQDALENARFDDREESEADDLRLVSQLNMKQNAVIQKGNNSTGYTLDFNVDKERENGDLEQASQWFARFNNRKPTETELVDINKFIKRDLSARAEEDTVDID
eukprot:CAMPEP_0202725846 /NCGR_PEP_ID=MMETSP1385-20130828/184308_1 /ASSEMBLY_ACC=CAM_ASM_000861 /TAXON_ID=933848 /ORGANISM="Elphidium margaritaceum" /LENGTH=780 /DNA_ID=CAMNT_0049392051 /DNA_START=69 /DNA_END=2411 /DNA_ORIENTATION=+